MITIPGGGCLVVVVAVVVETVFTDKEWYDNLGVSKEIFQYIVSEIEDEIVRKDTEMCKEISSRKNWFGTIDHLHYTFRPNRAEFLVTRTNFTRARTTYPAGSRTGEILARSKSFTQQILSVPYQFFWYAYHFYPSLTKIFLSCKSALIKTIR